MKTNLKFSLDNLTLNDSLSSNSELPSQDSIFDDNFNFLLPNPIKNGDYALSFLLRTKGLITNYGSLCSKMFNQCPNQTQQEKFTENEVFDFMSEDEEIPFSNEDYINVVTQEPSEKQKVKQFKTSEHKFSFDFKRYDEKNRLNFMNSSIRKIFNKLVVLNKGRDDSKIIKKIRVYFCKICSKKFDDGRKLGGHVSKFHPNRKNNTTL